MTAATLKADLERSGFRLRRDGAQLLVSPGGQLSAEQRQAIALQKAALLALLPEAGPLPASITWQLRTGATLYMLTGREDRKASIPYGATAWRVGTGPWQALARLPAAWRHTLEK